MRFVDPSRRIPRDVGDAVRSGTARAQDEVRFAPDHAVADRRRVAAHDRRAREIRIADVEAGARVQRDAAQDLRVHAADRPARSPAGSELRLVLDRQDPRRHRSVDRDRRPRRLAVAHRLRIERDANGRTKVHGYDAVGGLIAVWVAVAAQRPAPGRRVRRSLNRANTVRIACVERIGIPDGVRRIDAGRFRRPEFQVEVGVSVRRRRLRHRDRVVLFRRAIGERQAEQSGQHDKSSTTHTFDSLHACRTEPPGLRCALVRRSAAWEGILGPTARAASHQAGT